MESLLLHSCCAPCSAAVIEWMLNNDIQPTVYYYNPNIFPREEYEKRKAELTRYCGERGITVIDGDWEHDVWRKAVRGLELEPERGRRCQACFNLRLAAAAKKCHELGLKRFTTTLASSRWKDLKQVDAAGFAAAALYKDVTYWDKNWRKGGLQERRNELIRLNHFYNQLWCGCEFSMAGLKEREARTAQTTARSNDNTPTISSDKSDGS